MRSPILFLLILFYLPFNAQVSILIKDCLSNQFLNDFEISIENDWYKSDKNGFITLINQSENLLISNVKSNLYINNIGEYIKLINNELCLLPSVNVDTVTIAISPFIKNEYSTITFDQTYIKRSSTLLGEKDIFKAIQYLPGVVQGQEGSAEINVRGGRVGENQVLIDGSPVLVTAHMLGLISDINSNVIDKVDFYKGGFPSEYGNRLSSFIDITTINPLKVENISILSLGTLTSSLTYSNQITNKTGLLFSIRSSPLSLFKEGFDGVLNLIERQNGEKATFSRINNYFGNGFLKLVHNHKENLSSSISIGSSYDHIVYRESSKRDKIAESGFLRYKIAIDDVWKNNFITYNSEYIPNYKIKFNLIAAYTNYKLSSDNFSIRREKNTITNNDYSNKYSTSRIGFKSQFFLTDNLKLYIGSEIEQNLFNNREINIDKGETTVESYNQNLYLVSTYGMIKGLILPQLNINVGLRMNHLLKGKINFLEPRINLNYQLSSKVELFGTYAKTSQFAHLLSRESVGVPYQIWLPVNESIDPARSEIYSVGSKFQISNWIISGEVYYKNTNNLILPNLGTDIFVINPNINTIIRDGESISKGLELSLQKQLSERFILNCSYTLAQTKIKFKGLSNGIAIPSFNDRRHNFNITLNANLTKKWQSNITWVYISGVPITIPEQILPGLGIQYDPVYGSISRSSAATEEFNLINLFNSNILGPFTYDTRNINNYKTKAHHRLDVNLTYQKSNNLTLSFGIYNAYLRKNPFITFIAHVQPNNINNFEAPLGLRNLSLFNFIPYFTCKKKF
jgi:outer membrane receptor protein involved in Fe transport